MSAVTKPNLPHRFDGTRPTLGDLHISRVRISDVRSFDPSLRQESRTCRWRRCPTLHVQHGRNRAARPHASFLPFLSPASPFHTPQTPQAAARGATAAHLLACLRRYRRQLKLFSPPSNTPTPPILTLPPHSFHKHNKKKYTTLSPTAPALSPPPRGPLLMLIFPHLLLGHVDGCHGPPVDRVL